MIIDPRNNYRIDEKSDNRNLNEYEEQAKKAYTTVKQKRKVEKTTLKLILEKKILEVYQVKWKKY